jgi:hypothetical protein
MTVLQLHCRLAQVEPWPAGALGWGSTPVFFCTSERGGEGYCVKGGGEEGERERERAREVRLHYSLGYSG